ncbi:hypothetical protein DACRYDRAFT_106849 [Dacryopinax primogenitus]|uniref:Uncharacterized protein n=1 Tax=Dacryopinax primogenitus (strain DJM 731) TaxID=1858805 RepID=M5G278_DACPD|nr:uncharacterized protein DACRYDRAFT_106849 [Dacryopinax primogenitus]EJU02794.1 hypothetical protein DACRYDRAFT_106849 [Dacryopinax primogenitus]
MPLLFFRPADFLICICNTSFPHLDTWTPVNYPGVSSDENWISAITHGSFFWKAWTEVLMTERNMHVDTRCKFYGLKTGNMIPPSGSPFRQQTTLRPSPFLGYRRAYLGAGGKQDAPTNIKADTMLIGLPFLGCVPGHT